MSKEEKLIIHISNFRKVKRVQDVLKVFAKIREETPSKLLLIGMVPKDSKWSNYAGIWIYVRVFVLLEN